MLVISGNLVLNAAEEALDPDCPLIGWHTIVTAAGIVSDTEEVNYPATNMANPATHLEWRAEDDTAQEITITTDEIDPIDYVAIAKHNLGSGEVSVSVGYYDTSSPPVWTELVEEVMLPDDGPAMFRFTEQSLATVVIRLGAGAESARIAVLYCGKLLVVERRVYVGHTPMPHGRRASVVNGRAESGNFLGRIVLGEWRETSVPLSLLTPEWYRAYMDPFLAVAKSTPFFFAWRPETYPREVGYGWLTEDPKPVNEAPSNRVSLDLKISGVT